MDVLLALLHLAAFVTLALGLALPAVRRIAIATLATAAIASVAAGALESGPRSLETVHTYTGFEGASLEAAMVAFPTGTVTAEGWLWPLPFAAFAVLWILWLLRLGGEPPRGGVVMTLAFSWTATAAWLGMQALAAPSAVVQPFALDRFLFPAGLTIAIAAARTAPGLVHLFVAVSACTIGGRLPAALFSKFASDHQLGTSLDIHLVRDIVNPVTRMQFEPRLAVGSLEQQIWLIWMEHVIVFPALYMMSLGGIAFCVHMFHTHGEPRLRKVE